VKAFSVLLEEFDLVASRGWNSTLKIAFISNCQRIGGAERVLLETIDVLSERGIECRVLLPRQGQFAEELSRRGIQYAIVRSAFLTMTGKPTPWQRFKAVLRFIAAAFLAARKIAKWKCDVIYSNTVTVGHGAIAAKLLRKPHIWHLHEFGKEDHGFGFYFGERFSCRAIGSMSSTCITVSKALAAKYQQFISRSKLTVLYPSMHLQLERMERPHEPTAALLPCDAQFRCIIVGGIFAGKRQEDAVRALALVRKGGLNAQLLLVGGLEDTLYHKHLAQIIRDNDLENKAIFTGEVRDARPLIQASDVVLVCSRSEAFGRVSIEAMLAGKPVIGAAAGATPELVQDGFNGVVFKLADSVSLAEKIRYLYQHPDVRRRLGENGQQWAHSLFTKERYSGELFGILNTVQKPAGSQTQ
jgi:glycosyltransferase involved in cell wall biosynthesis